MSKLSESETTALAAHLSRAEAAFQKGDLLVLQSAVQVIQVVLFNAIHRERVARTHGDSAACDAYEQVNAWDRVEFSR